MRRCAFLLTSWRLPADSVLLAFSLWSLQIFICTRLYKAQLRFGLVLKILQARDIFARRHTAGTAERRWADIKLYYVTVPRERRIYFAVEAEDSRDARFEAIKHLVYNIMHEMIPLDIVEGEEVFQCGGCAQFLQKPDLNHSEGRLYCRPCESILVPGFSKP